MENYQIVILAVIPIIYIVWNIVNEVNVSHFWNTGDVRYVDKWHKRDSVKRILLFPLIVLGIAGLHPIGLKIFATAVILYRPIFNLGFNYYRNKDTFKRLNTKERVNVLLYLSEYSVIDSLLIKANNWLYKNIDKFSRWLFKVSKDRFYIKFNVKFQYFNLVLIIVEVLIAASIWIWF
jgi:phage pi2 protein 07